VLVKAHQQGSEEPHSSQEVVVSSELNHRHQASVQVQARSELHKHSPHKVKALALSRHSEIHNLTQVEEEDYLEELHNNHQHKALVAEEDLEHPHRLQEE
jgi:hypothetical protein